MTLRNYNLDAFNVSAHQSWTHRFRRSLKMNSRSENPILTALPFLPSVLRSSVALLRAQFVRGLTLSRCPAVKAFTEAVRLSTPGYTKVLMPNSIISFTPTLTTILHTEFPFAWFGICHAGISVETRSLAGWRSACDRKLHR